MTNQELDKIKEVVEEFFKQTGLEVEVEVKSPVDSTIPVVLKAEEPQILIGEKGQTLVEIQRLLKVILRKKISPQEPFYIDVDINDYKKKKSEYLREMAKAAADDVALSKTEKNLPPMSPYERRIVHMELASRADVVTESIGQGIERMVTIKPRP